MHQNVLCRAWITVTCTSLGVSLDQGFPAVTFWNVAHWPPLSSLLLQRTCSFGGFDLSNRSLHVVGGGSESNVSAQQLSESSPLQSFVPHDSDYAFRFKFHLPCSFSVPLCSAPFLVTEQRPGAHLQRGGQIADNVPDLARQESQVGQGDDEEAHVQEVQQLPLRAGLGHCLLFCILHREAAWYKSCNGRKLHNSPFVFTWLKTVTLR